ncbi:Uncharacterised protein [Candidatus Gugararchaeum adminiculabundum]|nr:Uncharacterised protein [Candidatus Gugararchaeum adminiculabundum]
MAEFLNMLTPRQWQKSDLVRKDGISDPTVKIATPYGQKLISFLESIHPLHEEIFNAIVTRNKKGRNEKYAKYVNSVRTGNSLIPQSQIEITGSPLPFTLIEKVSLPQLVRAENRAYNLISGRFQEACEKTGGDPENSIAIPPGAPPGFGLQLFFPNIVFVQLAQFESDLHSNLPFQFMLQLPATIMCPRPDFGQNYSLGLKIGFYGELPSDISEISDMTLEVNHRFATRRFLADLLQLQYSNILHINREAMFLSYSFKSQFIDDGERVLLQVFIHDPMLSTLV